MSKLIPCKSCGHKIDKGAVKCPSCGASRTTAGRVVLLMILTLMIAWFLGGFLWVDGCVKLRQMDKKAEKSKADQERLMKESEAVFNQREAEGKYR